MSTAPSARSGSTNLILTLPHGVITATSLGIEGFARHRSPGSGKHFSGRTILVDLAVSGGSPGFRYLDEGGWRDADGDSTAALDAVTRLGNRTKTALSNYAFSCTPLAAYRAVYLVKTGGEALPMEPSRALLAFPGHECSAQMTTEQVARAIGRPISERRSPRLYLVLCPVELVVMSNLAPEEYAWYATHRPGKVFRQVLFTELRADPTHLAAASRFEVARRELGEKPVKKTKTIIMENCLNRIPFSDWAGYQPGSPGGLYAGDRDSVSLWQFPSAIPLWWHSAEG
jgi:hypothetical protein